MDILRVGGEATLRRMYIGFKFAHILIAIITLGTGAAVGLLALIFGDDPTHGEFVLRMVRRLSYVIVVPGYLLMLGTGMWMGHLASLLDADWTEAAMNLWGVGASFIALALIGVHRRIAWLARGSGLAAASVVLLILYFMVFKP
ncbi:MAG TPA: DUF2269 family protein [Steroidobacteraceae bacterium]|nr:DUF2269 family protein [Steroidobacteraceae bacterium]